MAKSLTSDDVKKIVNDVIDEKHVATKDDLKRFATKDDLKRFATKDDIISIKDDLLSFKDAILKEILNLRDDVAIVTGYRDMIEDHDQRIAVLEKKVGIPQN